MTKFAEHLRLREPRRESLKLSPEHDAAIFVDIDGNLPKVDRQLAALPKLVVMGDFGTGKSHMLRHIEKHMAPAHDYRGLYVTLSGFERKSRFARVHALVMEQLENALSDVYNVPGTERSIERANVSLDVKHALRQLRNPKAAANHAKIRGWLKGPGITGPQASKLGFSGRLLDQAGPAQLVDLWKTIADIYKENAPKHETLLLLFDEGESIQQILGPEGQLEIGNGFRHLLDPDNQSIGCVFGLNLPVTRGGGYHPFLRADVKRRYDDMAIKLMPIASSDRARKFVETLWPKLAEDGPPLLAPLAMKYVGDHLAELRERLDTATTDAINRAATQADLLVVLDSLARAAVETGTALPLSREVVRAWLPVMEA